jgi:hypothetical protein
MLEEYSKLKKEEQLSKHLKNNIMKALVYYGPEMGNAEMPDAIIEQPTDVLLK